MGLCDISQAVSPGFFIVIFVSYTFLGHCFLLNRALSPMARINKPITHTETCPGFLYYDKLSE